MRSAFGQQFDVPAGYLNTASIGIPSAAAADAVEAAVGTGAPGRRQPGDFDEPVAGRPGRVRRAGRGARRPGGDRRRGVGAGRADRRERAGRCPGARRARRVHQRHAAVRGAGGRGVTVDRGRARTKLGARAGDYDLVAVSVVQSADGRIVDLDALRAAGRPAPGWCSTRPRRSAGWTPTWAGPTPWSVPGTSGCSARAAWRGWRVRPGVDGRCRTRPAGTPATTRGRASTGCRCGWRRRPVAGHVAGLVLPRRRGGGAAVVGRAGPGRGARALRRARRRVPGRPGPGAGRFGDRRGAAARARWPGWPRPAW